ncbi:DedA family protein [Microlunatus parietis]|uniref:Membrane protein DedA with SNARE-associated domain n=1 Tax=Microlunatus parietis TaxID=682979 RepID=A0A7Y9LCJ2_9ACTN|nr:VTT domain-containing protein [Microlunatus parietis]NYE71745.1 membrane protein DedA with SNARE-associated domain [Microlunatus parietis]
MDFWRDWPYPVALSVLFLVILLRANATYWIGRAANAGADRTRLHRLMETSGYRRARDLVVRWGAPVITVSFLTVGLQTLINLAAGALRMPYRRYLPAMLIGGVLWSFLYATFGFVSFEVWQRLYERWPGPAVALLVLLVLILVGFIIRQATRSRRRDHDQTSPEGADRASGDNVGA